MRSREPLRVVGVVASGPLYHAPGLTEARRPDRPAIPLTMGRERKRTTSTSPHSQSATWGAELAPEKVLAESTSWSRLDPQWLTGAACHRRNTLRLLLGPIGIIFNLADRLHYIDFAGTFAIRDLGLPDSRIQIGGQVDITAVVLTDVRPLPGSIRSPGFSSARVPW